MVTLDSIDIALLVALQSNSKCPIKELAAQVNLSISPVHERIKKLEATGIIERYGAIVNPKKLGKNLVIYCQVTLIKHQEEIFKEFEDYVQELDEIMEVSYIAGGYDFLLKMIVNDMEDYQRFVLQKISKLSIVQTLQSSFVIKTVKNSTVLMPF